MNPKSKPKAGQRLQTHLVELGLNQADLGRFLGRSQTWVSQSLFGDPERTIRRLAVNQPQHLQRLIQKLQLDPAGFSRLMGLDVEALLAASKAPGVKPKASEPLRPELLRGIPLVSHRGTVSAGLSGSSSESHGVRPLPQDWLGSFDPGEVFTLDVNGDSMTSTEVTHDIREGYTVLVHGQLQPQPGDVVVVWLPERELGVIKVWHQEQRHIVLESYNPQIPPIVLSPEEPGELCGVVLGWWVAYRQLARQGKGNRRRR
jgi:SOS-response transcriptional repressor LexA